MKSKKLPNGKFMVSGLYLDVLFIKTSDKKWSKKNLSNFNSITIYYYYFL